MTGDGDPALKDIVQAERLRRGWSLRRAERETGIHNAHLAQIEQGTISRPDHNVLFALAAAYGLEYEKLLRLAGHLKAGGVSERRSPYGAVAWKALTELSPEEQREVVDFIARLQQRRQERPSGQ